MSSGNKTIETHNSIDFSTLSKKMSSPFILDDIFFETPKFYSFYISIQ